MLVTARCPQAGQSTGAGPIPRFGIATAVRNCCGLPGICCGGICAVACGLKGCC
jgi:hypothetical protein